MEGATAQLVFVGSADRGKKFVKRGGCLDSIELKGVVPVEELTWVLYVNVSGCTNMPPSGCWSAT